MTEDLHYDPDGYVAGIVLPTFEAAGVSQACTNNDGHEFGTAGLASFFSSRATVPPERILRELEAHLEHLGMASHQTDDMTLLLVQRRADSA